MKTINVHVDPIRLLFRGNLCYQIPETYFPLLGIWGKLFPIPKHKEPKEFYRNPKNYI